MCLSPFSGQPTNRQLFLQLAPPRGMLAAMGDVTHILAALENGDPSAAEELLPLIYDEPRKTAFGPLPALAPCFPPAQ